MPLVSVPAGPLLAWIHGFTPWQVSSLDAWYTQVGDIQCGAKYARALLSGVCPVAGVPAGQEYGNGWPITVAGAAIARITGMSAVAAWTILAAVMMGVATYGMLKLGARLGLGPAARSVAAVLFLCSPTLFGMRYFGSTLWGMLLVPAACWAQLKAADWLTARRAVFVPVLLAWTVGVFALLATDGYGFVLTQTATGIVLLAGFRLRQLARSIIRPGGFLVANVGGYLLYRTFLTNALALPASDIGLFRAMGMDLVTFVWPSKYQWWLPDAHAITPGDLWGDGTNAAFNFVGWTLAILGIVGVVAVWRRRNARMWTWIGIGVLAFVMALGPSLKIDATRAAVTGVPTYEDYLMPPEAATATLPTQLLYEHVPGLSQLRATYRWMVLVRLTEAVLGAYGLQALARRGRRWKIGAMTLGALALVEIAPSTGIMPENGAEVLREVDEHVVKAIDAALPDNTMAVVAPGAAEANDYLAAYLATGAHLRLFNVGGDKALRTVMPQWPEEITHLILDLGDYPELVVETLEITSADAVIVPRFLTRIGASPWPPRPEVIERGDEAVASLTGDPRLSVADYEYFAVVTLAGQ
jgi:hypothetical protein